MRVKLPGVSTAKRSRAKPAAKTVKPVRAATWSKAPKRPTAAGFYPIVKRAPLTVLPTPRPEDNGQLDLVIKSTKPGGRTRKATAAPSRQLERPVHRSIGGHLNSNMKGGGAWHPVNEQALMALLPPERRNAYKQALLSDGSLPGVPDFVLMWQFPADWRAILVAAGIKLPARMALCGGLEVKPPGWKPDARWRAGTQPKAHATLNSWGVPTAVVQSFAEAEEVARGWGAPMKFRILTPRGYLGPVNHETTGGTKKKAAKAVGARRGQADAPHEHETGTTTMKVRKKHESKSRR